MSNLLKEKRKNFHHRQRQRAKSEITNQFVDLMDEQHEKFVALQKELDEIAESMFQDFTSHRVEMDEMFRSPEYFVEEEWNQRYDSVMAEEWYAHERCYEQYDYEFFL